MFCYYNAPGADTTTRRLRALADGWRHIFSLTDAQAARRIRADGCDILVDLGGHTQGNRLSVFALRPAPVRATYLGYPDVTGLTAMQYRITDAICDPPGVNLGGLEKLVRIPECWLCYQPDRNAPAVGPLPCDADSRFTFGCLNQYPKISPETVTLWAKILNAIPGARLLLGSRSLGDPRVAASAVSRFHDAGIDPARMELIDYVRPQRAHLNTYNRVDVALDPFPFNGATTTCEALWMGAPVITLKGNSHVSRMGCSLLNAANLRELIAEDESDYVRKAVRLASSRQLLREMRSGMRRRIANSVLCDHVGFTRRFEDVLRIMWADNFRKSSKRRG